MCDELKEYPSDVYVNDCEGECTDEVTGVALLRDDVGKARAEEVAWCEKFKACEEVTDETCVSRTGRKPTSCRWRDINEGDNEGNWDVCRTDGTCCRWGLEVVRSGLLDGG